jgi:hypothetical protein
MLTALLTLVTAINSDGQPKLGDTEGRRICNRLLDDPSSRNKETLFNKLADLLVRDAEVIAIIPEQLPAQTHVAQGTVDARYNFLAVYEDSVAASFGDSFHRYNPDRKDNHFHIEGSDVVLVEDGKSFWKEIAVNPWCELDNCRYVF